MNYSNIEISNIKQNFFSTILINDFKENEENEESKENEENEESKENKKYKNKLVNQNFYSVNELNISNKIKQITDYYKYFLIIEKCENINIHQLNDKIIAKLNGQQPMKYLIYKYDNKSVIDFNNLLMSFISPKLFTLHIFQSFSYILKGLIQLNENSICFFNISPENIKFPICCREKPLLENFQESLNADGKIFNEEYITNIIKKKELDYTHKPLEVHVLFYLIQNDLSTISYSFIEEICEIFIKKMSVLKIFSAKFSENYKKACIESLKKYINKPRSFIITDILTHNDKWDIYSLCIIYLYIIGTIIRVFSLNKTFLNKLTIELCKNIHPDPSKREILQSLDSTFEILFSNETNWSFTNDMKHNKMDECIKKLFE